MKIINKKILRVVLGIYFLISSSLVLGESSDWLKFKNKFINDQGRILDTGNNHISHSEGQGFGMLLAVANNDKETFERIWSWTNENLGIRDDSLFAWRWDPNNTLHIEDTGNASDGDIFIAWAMARAAKKWQSPIYLSKAKELSKAIRTQLVAESYGDTLLLPGAVWPRRKGHTVINLSYWVYPAFEELNQIDSSPVWEKLIKTGLDLMERAKFGAWELPADWMAVKHDGNLSQLDDFPFVFGYEAVRIPLYYLWAGYDEKDVLRIFQSFWSTTAKGSKLITMLGLAMDSTIQQENVLAYRATNSLVECAVTNKPSEVLSSSFSEYEDYYSAALFLIAKEVAKERLPKCINSEVANNNEKTKTPCKQLHDSNCPLVDPIKPKVEIFDLVVQIKDITQIPPSNLHRPLTRINYLSHANDNSDRLFVIDEDGKIYIIQNERLIKKPFLDLLKIRGSKFYSDNEDVGLRSLAFHPEFSIKGKPGYLHLYTLHSETADSINENTPVYPNNAKNTNHYDVISEWKVDPNNQNLILSESQREIIRIAQREEYNNLGSIGFDPTISNSDPNYGLLYFSLGTSRLKQHKAQDLTNYFGKILRIDPVVGSNTSGFKTPEVGPFINKENIDPHIWAYGFKNPLHFSWDSETGDMYITDSSRRNIEEVNIGKAGANYGWEYREGKFKRELTDDKSKLYPLPKNDQEWNFTYPILQYDLDEGQSISGGFVYRGKAIPELYGYYVFGDFINGRIFYADINNIEPNTLIDNEHVDNTIRELRLFYKGAEKNMLEILNYDSRADLTLGQDSEGEIYILTKRDGMVRKLLAMPK